VFVDIFNLGYSLILIFADAMLSGKVRFRAVLTFE
jgi:hypothetical protein